MSPLEIITEQREGQTLMALVGELDIASAPRFEEGLAEVERDTPGALILDLRKVDFIDSTGLATLLHGAKPAQNGESNVALVSQGGEVRKLLELTAIDRTIPVYESLDSAIEAVLSED